MSSKMEKLQMCRICLAKNVHMYVVVNETLHDLYKKLTDNPFVTEDSRPILACFICCAQLKKCYRFKKKCLEAEEQLAKMMMIKEEYEIKPLINQDQFELFHGFIRTPIDTISIVDVDQTENIVVKEELPAVCERLDDVIEIKEECESDDDLKKGHKYEEYMDLNDTPLHNSESDSEEYIPLMKVKSDLEEEQEVSKMVEEIDDLVTGNTYDNYLDIKDIPLHHCQSDSEDDIPLMKVKTEVEEQEVSKMQQETDSILIAKKRKVEMTKAETMTVEQKEIDTKIIEENQDRPRVQNIINTTKDRDSRVKSKEVSVVKKFKRYECDVCHKSFRRKCLLVDHLLMHIDKKPFKCDMCQRSFRSKLYLRQHIVKHSSEKPFKCNVCGREYSNKSSLTRHYQIHTGGKPFKCDVCGCEFSMKYGLTQHYRKHTGEKPYKCKICQYKSSTKQNLKTHNRVCTLDNPFKCDECPSSFLNKSRLISHKEIHHPVNTIKEPYKCNLCPYKCYFINELVEHSRLHTVQNPYHKSVIRGGSRYGLYGL